MNILAESSRLFGPGPKSMNRARRAPQAKRILAASMLLLGICGGCLTAQETEARIRAVESGLQPAYRLVSEPKPGSGWTLLERMAFHRVPALSIAVIDQGRVIWAKAYGTLEAGGERKANAETIFQAASVGKVVTAATVLALVERGRLDLDVDVSRYLSSWHIPASDFAAESKVTLSALLSHTAGFRKGRSGEFEYDLVLPTLLQVLNGEKPSPHPPVALLAKPGSAFAYSNVGFYIIQQVLEDVCGKPFGDIVKETVLEPLGMTRSFYGQRLPPELESNAAFGHGRDGALIKGRYRIYPAYGSGSGFWSTPGDLAKLAVGLSRAYLGQAGALFSQALAVRMATPVIGSYGLGMFTQPGDARSAYHGGDTTGYHNLLRIHLSGGWGLVVMTNGDNGPRIYDEVQRAVAEAYDWPAIRPAALRPMALKPEEILSLEGRYEDGVFPVLNVMVEDGRLVSDFYTAPGAAIVAERPRSFFSAEQGVGYEFELDAEGRADRVVVTSLGNGTVARRMGPPRRSIKATLLPIFEKDGIRAGLAAMDRLPQARPEEYVWGEAEVNSLGYELINRGRLDDALAVFERNVELHPESANAHDSLGEACARAGRGDLAIAHYEEALRLNPKSRNALEQLQKLRRK
jgi:CubicO group peptidase (beta-lactamase class C family)